MVCPWSSRSIKWEIKWGSVQKKNHRHFLPFSFKIDRWPWERPLESTTSMRRIKTIIFSGVSPSIGGRWVTLTKEEWIQKEIDSGETNLTLYLSFLSILIFSLSYVRVCRGLISFSLSLSHSLSLSLLAREDQWLMFFPRSPYEWKRQRRREKRDK